LRVQGTIRGGGDDGERAFFLWSCRLAHEDEDEEKVGGVGR
jgi:hypothetical protein